MYGTLSFFFFFFWRSAKNKKIIWHFFKLLLTQGHMGLGISKCYSPTVFIRCQPSFMRTLVIIWWNTGYYFSWHRTSFKSFVAVWNFNMGSIGIPKMHNSSKTCSPRSTLSESTCLWAGNVVSGYPRKCMCRGDFLCLILWVQFGVIRWTFKISDVKIFKSPTVFIQFQIFFLWKMW